MEENVKNKSKRKTIIWILAICICFEVFGIGVIYLVSKLNNKHFLDKYMTNITKLYNTKQSSGIAGLEKINKDALGWITCEGVDISLPVVKENLDETDFYLNHDFYKKKNILGVPYQRASSSIGETDVTTIVGHSLFENNDKTYSVFGNLYDYIGTKNGQFIIKKDLSSYNISIETKEKTFEYVVMSAFEFKADKITADQAYVYEKTNFTSVEDFNRFNSIIKSLSIQAYPTTAEYGDKFLTLFSCSKNDLDYRVIVIAKQI